jgi:hypothetical protein
LIKNEEQIEELRKTLPNWIFQLERPAAPALIPNFGPLDGIRVVSSDVIVAQPFIGTKLAITSPR